MESALILPSARPLKCHELKCCTSWRETCLASDFAFGSSISGLGLQIAVLRTFVRTLSGSAVVSDSAVAFARASVLHLL